MLHIFCQFPHYNETFGHIISHWRDFFFIKKFLPSHLPSQITCSCTPFFYNYWHTHTPRYSRSQKVLKYLAKLLRICGLLWNSAAVSILKAVVKDICDTIYGPNQNIQAPKRIQFHWTWVFASISSTTGETKVNKILPIDQHWKKLSSMNNQWTPLGLQLSVTPL